MKRGKGGDSDRRIENAAGRPVQLLPIFLPACLEDLLFWIETDPRTAARLVRLIKETLRDPFDGIGKPEALRGQHGVWSRRLTEEHRLTYHVVGMHVHYLQARFHYSK